MDNKFNDFMEGLALNKDHKHVRVDWVDFTDPDGTEWVCLTLQRGYVLSVDQKDGLGLNAPEMKAHRAMYGPNSTPLWDSFHETVIDDNLDYLMNYFKPIVLENGQPLFHFRFTVGQIEAHKASIKAILDSILDGVHDHARDFSLEKNQFAMFFGLGYRFRPDQKATAIDFEARIINEDPFDLKLACYLRVNRKDPETGKYCFVEIPHPPEKNNESV